MVRLSAIFFSLCYSVTLDFARVICVTLSYKLFRLDKLRTGRKRQRSPGPGSPGHPPAAGQLADQEGQRRGFLGRSVGLEGLGPQAFGELSLSTTGLQKDLQDLGNIVSIHTNIQQMFSKSCFGL